MRLPGNAPRTLGLWPTTANRISMKIHLANSTAQDSNSVHGAAAMVVGSGNAEGRPWHQSRHPWPHCLKPWAGVAAILLISLGRVYAADVPATPLKVLYLTGGCCHDYKAQAPHFSTNLAQLVNAALDVRFGLEVLTNAAFADGYDAVLYNVCDETAPDQSLANAMQAARNGKPTVLIHCSIHAFRNSPHISQWETFCGMRSKVHDLFEPFSTTKADPESPITKLFPEDWKTPGDELYQTIAIDPKSHQLLKAKSPHDGRVHVVCWTSQFGQGRVFATTLGHDMKTCLSPDYLRLVANGLLWACGKLDINR